MTARQGTVLVFGTFDPLHEGHVDYFRQARAYGSRLVCVVGRDATVQRVKGHAPHADEEARQAAVMATGLVDEAALGNEKDMYAVLDRFKPNVICLGYDQTAFTEALPQELEKRGLSQTTIVRLKPYKPEQFKSSFLRQV